MPIPPFVAHLRSMVGTEPLWLPGVIGAVLDGDRILLARRSDTGLWALVGGILEPGEDPVPGLAREVLEETGVEVAVEGLAAVTVTPQLTYPNGDRSTYLDLLFVCRPVSTEAAAGARVADDESLDVRWFGLDALPADLNEDTAPRLEQVRRYLADPTAGPWLVR